MLNITAKYTHVSTILDIKYGLICSSGDDYDSTNIPGCIGLPGISSYDYCSHGGIWLQMVGDANKPPELFPLDVCQGAYRNLC